MAIGVYHFTVAAENDGQSVKTYLRRACGLSARSMTVLKYAGMGITRDGAEVRAHDIVRGGDALILKLPVEENEISPVRGELNVLFEDDRLLIVDKPAAMPVHPTKVHQLDTLANIVAAYQQERSEQYVFRTLNRLDKDTSGIVIIAKDRITYSLIRSSIRKTYYAVCEGLITEPGTVDAPIALAPDSKIRRQVSADGAAAITHYEPVKRGNGHTLCRVTLETGRTHQIRCHMSFLGHPLAGDDLYGGSRRYIDRQALHCAEALLAHPEPQEILTIKSDLPVAFLQILS